MNRSRSVDLKAIAVMAMEKYGFRPQFPVPVVQEVNAMPDQIPPGNRSATRDLRSLLWSSIDNSDSMDLDQLEFCETGPEGTIQVRIAVADVDIFVPEHSPADRYAVHNGTSVYTGIVTFPMLPDRLSKDLSSLLPDRDRLAMVVEYTILADGSFRPGKFPGPSSATRQNLFMKASGNGWKGPGQSPLLSVIHRVSRRRLTCKKKLPFGSGKSVWTRGHSTSRPSKLNR